MADEIPNTYVEAEAFAMDGSEKEVEVPDGVVAFSMTALNGNAWRYYISSEATNRIPLIQNVPESKQEPNWANRKFYLTGASGVVVYIEWMKGSLS